MPREQGRAVRCHPARLGAVRLIGGQVRVLLHANDLVIFDGHTFDVRLSTFDVT